MQNKLISFNNCFMRINIFKLIYNSNTLKNRQNNTIIQNKLIFYVIYKTIKISIILQFL